MKTQRQQGLSPVQNAGKIMMEQNQDFLHMMQQKINDLVSEGLGSDDPDQRAYGEINALLVMANNYKETDAGEMYRQMACFIKDHFPFKSKSNLSKFDFS